MNNLHVPLCFRMFIPLCQFNSYQIKDTNSKNICRESLNFPYPVEFRFKICAPTYKNFFLVQAASLWKKQCLVSKQMYTSMDLFNIRPRSAIY